MNEKEFFEKVNESRSKIECEGVRYFFSSIENNFIIEKMHELISSERLSPYELSIKIFELYREALLRDDDSCIHCDIIDLKFYKDRLVKNDIDKSTFDLLLEEIKLIFKKAKLSELGNTPYANEECKCGFTMGDFEEENEL